MRICGRNISADKGTEGGGGSGVSGTGAKILLQPVVQTMVRCDVPVELYGGADLRLQPVEDPTPGQMDA